MNWLEAAARWYGAIAVCTWALAPFVRWLCIALDDRGVSIGRPVALLATLYPAWLFAALGLTAFDARLIAGTMILAGGAGWLLLLRQSELDGRWIRGLVLAELGSLVLFAAYVWLRGFTPQIQGTEKPMDMAFLASSARAVSIPPPDPWFAGLPINYYYLGYLINGTIGRMAGVPPETGFNLALVTIFCMTAVGAFGVTWNVVRPAFRPLAGALSGAIAAILVAIAGNLYAPFRLIQAPGEVIQAAWGDSAVGIGWRSSRIVCDGARAGNLCLVPATETINEFPFFSFLLGDLHPHVMALPYTLVALALSWNLAGSDDLCSGGGRRWWLMRLMASGAIIGALYALNAWDLPTFLAAALVGLLIGSSGRFRNALPAAILLIGSATIAWLPYILTYRPPTMPAPGQFSGLLDRVPLITRLFSVVAIHLGERTSVGEYLTIFGIPYGFGLVLVFDAISRTKAASLEGRVTSILIPVVAVVILGIVLSAPVVLLCGIPLILALNELRGNFGKHPHTFALGAYSLAWLISIVVEVVYVRDVFNDRMNTLFKFYYQAWTLYAVATGVTVVLSWEMATRHVWRRWLIAAATTGALLLALIYPAISSYQWTEQFSNWQGLDGLAYGDDSDPDDTQAIRWLASHAAPGDIVLEAAGCSYHPFGRLPFSRVSAFTGVPTVIGWGDHERQWRAGQPELLGEIDDRQVGVAALFAAPEGSRISRLGIRWLFVGEYEAGDWRAECATAGPYSAMAEPGYPGAGWEEVFHSGATRIYRRTAA